MKDEQEHKEAVAKAASELPPKVVKVSEELSCKLNEVEWQNKARDLAEAHKEVARQLERKKTVTAGLANDVKIAQAKESNLADVVASREEQRDVTVEVKYDYELGKVTKTRTDTKEVISKRDMTDNERQAELELTDANDFIESRHDEPKAGSPFDDDDTSEQPSESEDSEGDTAEESESTEEDAPIENATEDDDLDWGDDEQ